MPRCACSDCDDNMCPVADHVWECEPCATVWDKASLTTTTRIVAWLRKEGDSYGIYEATGEPTKEADALYTAVEDIKDGAPWNE
jgi:hypothetical protein